jgi:hypothetical protein
VGATTLGKCIVSAIPIVVVVSAIVSGWWRASLSAFEAPRFMHRLFSEPVINAEYALFIHLAFLAFSPGFWLVVHCSSGDCL